MMKNKIQKIKHLLKKAQQEFMSFKKYRRFTNLSQACEKTWVAFILALEYNSKKEIKNNPITSSIASDLGYGELYYRAKYLHIIHYEGSPELRYDEIIPEIEYILYRIKGMANRRGGL